MLEHLSHRQREVASLLPDGLSDKEIGARLGIAEATVGVHLQTVYRCLGVNNRTQAAVKLTLGAGT